MITIFYFLAFDASSSSMIVGAANPIRDRSINNRLSGLSPRTCYSQFGDCLDYYVNAEFVNYDNTTKSLARSMRRIDDAFVAIGKRVAVNLIPLKYALYVAGDSSDSSSWAPALTGNYENKLYVLRTSFGIVGDISRRLDVLVDDFVLPNLYIVSRFFHNSSSSTIRDARINATNSDDIVVDGSGEFQPLRVGDSCYERGDRLDYQISENDVISQKLDAAFWTISRRIENALPPPPDSDSIDGDEITIDEITIDDDSAFSSSSACRMESVSDEIYAEKVSAVRRLADMSERIGANLRRLFDERLLPAILRRFPR